MNASYRLVSPRTGYRVRVRVRVRVSYSQYEAIRGILVYEYTLAQCLTFRVRFDYTWIIRVFPAPPGGPN